MSTGNFGRVRIRSLERHSVAVPLQKVFWFKLPWTQIRRPEVTCPHFYPVGSDSIGVDLGEGIVLHPIICQLLGSKNCHTKDDGDKAVFENVVGILFGLFLKTVKPVLNTTGISEKEPGTGIFIIATMLPVGSGIRQQTPPAYTGEVFDVGDVVVVLLFLGL